MTDLEMTKLCAEAIGIWEIRDYHETYDPLHDDAQAMGLVKRFRLFINSADEEAYWKVAPHGQGVTNCHSDLNRAIVECVSQMQANKT